MKKFFLITLAGMLLVSCGTTGPTKLYSWYNYEDVAYKYSKTPNETLQAQLLATYEAMINKQGGKRKTVPPGLCAEYGYMLCKMKRVDEGIGFLKKEIELYPESEVYVSNIIKMFEQ